MHVCTSLRIIHPLFRIHFMPKHPYRASTSNGEIMLYDKALFNIKTLAKVNNGDTAKKLHQQTTKQKQTVIARAPQHPMHQPKANFIFNTRHLKNAHIYIAEVSKNILKLLIQVRVYYSQTLATLYFLFICTYNVQFTYKKQLGHSTSHPPPSSYFIFIWHTEKNTNLQSIILQISKTYSIIHNLY